VLGRTALPFLAEIGRARDLQVVLCVASSELSSIRAFGQTLGRVLADRLEHQEPTVGDGLDQARLDESVEIVERRSSNRLGRFECERPREQRQSREHCAKLVSQQLVTPLDRRAQRALPCRRIAASRGQQRQPRVEAREQGVGVERAKT
jgi:hypothetical protein